MLHYYPWHVSSINMPIFRRKNCIHTATGIVALCKRLHSTPVESRLSRLSTGVLPAIVRKHDPNPSILTCVSKICCLNRLFSNIPIIQEFISEVIRSQSCHTDSCSLLTRCISTSIFVRRTSYWKLSWFYITTVSQPVRAWAYRS
jgi:hypothetical protein